MGLAIGRCLGIFCTDNVMVVLQDMEWLQGALNVPIGLFFQYGLVANVAESKSMTC